MTESSGPLVSTSWLADHLSDPTLRIIDVSWKFRVENGRGLAFDDRQNFLAEHIPGAVFVGMATELSDPDHPVPDMMVGPQEFARVMRRLGVNNDSQVVVYDDSGLPLAAARLWWALSRYGHNNVTVLDGGLLQWKLECRPLTTEETPPPAGDFEAVVKPEWNAAKAEVLSAIEDPETSIVDCLPNELFRGVQSHTWGGRSGHIPVAINIPAVSNLDPSLEYTSLADRTERLKERGSFKFGSRDTLLKFYSDKGLTPDKNIITYCGRGIAASCGLLALRYLGYHQSRLYDGSWAEWSADETLPIETP